MANCTFEVALVSGPLGLASPETTQGAGAIVDFFGNVRPLENGEQIEGIEYEAHPEMAGHQLRKIARDAAERFDLLAIQLHHSVGFVAVGETSLFLRVASVHRGAAFEASRWIVDELKRRVPIWKSVRFRGGRKKEKGTSRPALV
jgi:molybdopterin synthase catalytic subunit